MLSLKNITLKLNYYEKKPVSCIKHYMLNPEF